MLALGYKKLTMQLISNILELWLVRSEKRGTKFILLQKGGKVFFVFYKMGFVNKFLT